MGDNDGNGTNNYYYNNDTYYVNGTDYLELISQVENLTVEVEELTIEVEELTEVLEEMQSSKYDVPENSSIWMHERDQDNRDWEIIKNGSIITLEYWGENSLSINSSSPRNCSAFVPPTLTFYREDGVKIMQFYPVNLHVVHDDGSINEFWMENVEIIRECTLAEGETNDWINRYWSTIIITLPEEPTRVEIGLGISHAYYTFY